MEQSVIEDAQTSNVNKEATKLNQDVSPIPSFDVRLKRANQYIGLLSVALVLVIMAFSYLFYGLNQKMEGDLLSRHEIVFYPFDKAYKTLSEQGYDFEAIQKYNSNMIGILNSEGKVVLPQGNVQGQIPDALVVELMSVEDMNALAQKAAQ